MVVPVALMLWPRGIGQYRHAVNIAELALIGAKTKGGVALNVLHRLKAFQYRQFNTTGTNI